MAGKKCTGLADVSAEIKVYHKYLHEITGYIKKTKIHRTSPSSGVIIKDGRQVIKRDGVWYYVVK